jgi:hypothetical protein
MEILKLDNKINFIMGYFLSAIFYIRFIEELQFNIINRYDLKTGQKY